MKIAIIIPFFNPVGYRSHSVKLARCLEAFDRAGLAGDTFLAGAGAEKPPRTNILFWDDECPFMWHKERLLNLAARRLPPAYTHVVWADNDVIVGADFREAVEEALKEAKVVQCFRKATCVTTDGRPFRSRVSCLVPGVKAASGLVWGTSVSLFREGPGLFELALVGSGDAIFGDSVLQGAPSPSAPWLHNFELPKRFWSSPLHAALDAWRARLARWMGTGRAKAANTSIEVLMHGPLSDRMYGERHRLLGRLDPERHLMTPTDGVFRWTPAGKAAVEPGIRGYFYERREDE